MILRYSSKNIQWHVHGGCHDISGLNTPDKIIGIYLSDIGNKLLQCQSTVPDKVPYLSEQSLHTSTLYRSILIRSTPGYENSADALEYLLSVEHFWFVRIQEIIDIKRLSHLHDIGQSADDIHIGFIDHMMLGAESV